MPNAIGMANAIAVTIARWLEEMLFLFSITFILETLGTLKITMNCGVIITQTYNPLLLL